MKLKNLSTSSFKLITLPMSILALLLMSEMIFRMLYFGSASLTYFFNYSAQGMFYSGLVENKLDERIWGFKKNLETYYKGKPFLTDANGFVKQSSKHTSLGLKKIAILGRSTEMGVGLDYKDSWPSLLSNSIRTKAIINNYSMAGSSYIQLIHQYDLYIKDYRPDFILIPIHLQEWQMAIPLQTNILPKDNLATWSKPQVILGHFFIYNAIRFYFKNFRKKYLSNDWNSKAQQISHKNTKKKFTTLSRLIKKLSKKINADGTHVLFIAMPTLLKDNKVYSSKVREKLNKWVNTQEKVTLINMDLAVQKFYTEKNTVFYGDSHPNNFVHKKMYAYIKEQLEEIIFSKNGPNEENIFFHIHQATRWAQLYHIKNFPFARNRIESHLGQIKYSETYLVNSNLYQEYLLMKKIGANLEDYSYDKIEIFRSDIHMKASKLNIVHPSNWKDEFILY